MRSRKAGGQTVAFTGPGRMSKKGGLADKRGHSPCAGRGLALRREGEPAATRRGAALKRPAAGLRPSRTEGCFGKGLAHRPNRKEIDGRKRPHPHASRADSHAWSNPVRPNQMPLAISPDRSGRGRHDVVEHCLCVAALDRLGLSRQARRNPQGEFAASLPIASAFARTVMARGSQVLNACFEMPMGCAGSRSSATGSSNSSALR